MSLHPTDERSIRYFADRQPIERLYREIDHAYAMAGTYPHQAEQFLNIAELYVELTREREKKSLDFWEERF